jgi:hypothetical protein
MRARRRVIFGMFAGAIVIAVAGGVIAGEAALRHEGTAAGTRDHGRATSVAATAGVALGFVENRGQTDSQVKYYASGNRYAFYLTRDEVMLALTRKHSRRGVGVALRFLHRNPHSKPEGAERAPGTVNYLESKDPAA